MYSWSLWVKEGADADLQVNTRGKGGGGWEARCRSLDLLIFVKRKSRRLGPRGLGFGLKNKGVGWNPSPRSAIDEMDALSGTSHGFVKAR